MVVGGDGWWVVVVMVVVCGGVMVTVKLRDRRSVAVLRVQFNAGDECGRGPILGGMGAACVGE